MSQALIVIDVQNDFCPNGALAVADGDAVIAPINALMTDFATVVLTQDWHPSDHSSFAEMHPNARPYDQVVLPYGPQVLWPRHCVVGSDGAAFHPDLNIARAELILRKGFRPEIDSYSAFFENDKQTQTGLHGYLTERGVQDLTFVGLATDFCVAYSALDAARLGYRVTVRLRGCRAINLEDSLTKMILAMVNTSIEVKD